MTGLPEVHETSEVFRRVGGVELIMHLYHPADGRRRSRSGIVFFFGGGWVSGSADHFRPQASALAALGMVTACAEYRIAGKHGTTPLEAVSDAKSAFYWLHRNAARLGITSGKIAAAGGSAGGHLAACCAMVPGFVSDGEVCPGPDALVLFNPVLDTTGTGYGEEKIPSGRAKEISPRHHVKADLPPTLILHGSADTVVSIDSVEEFTGLMKESGNYCRLVSYPGRGHGFFNIRGTDEADYNSSLAEAVSFLREFGFL